MIRSAASRSRLFVCVAALVVTASGQSTERVSVSGAGAELPGGGAGGAISGDGRVAAFVAGDGVLPGDSNGFSDVFVRELATGVVRRVSLTAAGAQPNGPCFGPVLSVDGRYVAFSSWASNLAASDGNGAGADVFVKDLQTGALEHVSVSSQGVGGNSHSVYHDLSGDGRFVTFYSYATNLVPNDTNGQQDTFLFDRATGQVTCLSADPATGAPAGGGEASLSYDGRIVAFRTWAPLFGAVVSTVAVLDRQTGQVSPVAVGAGGAPVYAVGPEVAGDGSTVLFQSAFSLDPADTDFVDDVYAFDVATGAVRLVSVPPAATGFPAACSGGAISADARYATFSTIDPYLPIDGNGVGDSYLVDLATGDLELLTVGDSGQVGDAAGYVRGISDNGRLCVFGSAASNLVPGDLNGAGDVFVRDRCVAASWQLYGAGLPGTGGVPPGFALLGDPVIGTAPYVALVNPTGGPTYGLFALGSQPTSIPTPVYGTLLVLPDSGSFTTFVAQSPVHLMTLVIWNAPEFCGVHVYMQAALLDAAAPAGVSFTRGIDATIGG